MSLGFLHASVPSRTTRRHGVVLVAALILANVAAWAAAFAVFADRPAMMATCLLAWVFGLRHAVDADHIAAIDNVVRKLMHAGQSPQSAGLYFALGHSTVVIAATLLLAVTAVRLGEGTWAKTVVSAIGSAVSAIFLLLIAAVNLAIFVGLWRSFRSLPRDDGHDTPMQERALAQGGVLARLLAPAFRVVGKTWHMYPLGFLFGLGFDTATEIGLLGLSAAEAMRGASVLQVLVFPALFAAGMALVDTADSIVMVSAYRWAFTDPVRKLWYNLTITGASIVVAVVIGGLEALDVLGSRFGLNGEIWQVIRRLNDGLADVGLVVVGLFVMVWLISAVVYRSAIRVRASSRA
jgi:nickel/cobalt transporter (NiCoT) family protein